MNVKFRTYVDALPSLAEQLRTSVPLSTEDVSQLGVPGVYSFSEGGSVYYVGRTRNMRNRYKNHCHTSSKENTAAFAFRLARHATGQMKASYKPHGSRKALMTDSAFALAFDDAKDRISEMEVRFVRVADPILQTLLELYASMELGSIHNGFETS